MKRISKLNMAVMVLPLLLLLFAVGGCDSSQRDSDKSPAPADRQKVTIDGAFLAKLKVLSDINLTGTFQEGVGKGTDFSFANPGSGTSFTDPATGITYSQPANGITLAASALGVGGGNFSVDGKSIQLDYVLCATASDSSAFGGFLDADGFSLLLGISGNFEDFDESSDLEDLDMKIVYFFVFDDKAQGSYDVLDLENVDDDDDLQDIAFAMVFDYNAGTFYFSADGFLNVSGGAISYAGKMFKFDTNILDGDDDVTTNPKKVSASGTLNCNG